MATPRQEVDKNQTAINQYYGELGSALRRNVGAQQMGFNQAKGQVGMAYDEMTRALTRQANATATGLGNQLNMLGIGAATDAATQDLRGQLNQALISAARRKAAEQAGLTEQGRAYTQAGREGIGNAAREGVRVKSDARTALMEAITNLEAAEATAKGEIETQRLQGEIQLAQMRQQMAARRGGGGGGGRRGSPLDMLRAQLMGLEILEKQQELEQGPDSPWGESGTGGLNRFLSSPSDYWENQAGPKFRGELQNLIDYGYAQANNPSSVAAGMKDPFLIAMGNMSDVPSYINRDALSQALQIYFNKY